MSDIYCAKCGQSLPEGSIRYIVHVKITSDFDSFITSSEEEPSVEIQKMLKDMDTVDVHELEDEIYQEFALYLCGQCKRSFTRDILSGEEEHYSSPKNLGNIFH